MDEHEFDEFYQASFGRLVAQLHPLVGSWDEATDCVQEAFVRAWQRRRELSRAEAAPEAWVRTTARRLAISRWRRLVRARRDPDRALATCGPSGPNPDHVAVVAALQRLPEAQRTALVLHHVCDLSVAQVATETGVPAGTAVAVTQLGTGGGDPVPPVHGVPAHHTRLLTHDGHGKLRIGMTLAQAERTGHLAVPNLLKSPHCVTVRYFDHPVRTGHPRGSYVTSVVSARFGVVAVFARGQVATPEGIHNGSSAVAARAAYPQTQRTPDTVRVPLTRPGVRPEVDYSYLLGHGKVRELSVQRRVQDCFN